MRLRAEYIVSTIPLFSIAVLPAFIWTAWSLSQLPRLDLASIFVFAGGLVAVAPFAWWAGVEERLVSRALCGLTLLGSAFGLALDMSVAWYAALLLVALSINSTSKSTMERASWSFIVLLAALFAIFFSDSGTLIPDRFLALWISCLVAGSLIAKNDPHSGRVEPTSSQASPEGEVSAEPAQMQTGSLGHELNNLMTVITGNLAVLENRLGNQSEIDAVSEALLKLIRV